MSASAKLRGAAAVALAIGAVAGLAACGEDDDPTVASPPETTTSETSTTTTDETTSTTTTTDDDNNSGGVEPAVTPDEGHEGGGPDPGTPEYEAAEENANGGSQGSDSGGQSPTDAFEQHCDENPEACE